MEKGDDVDSVKESSSSVKSAHSVVVKKEGLNDDIKEFAETAMNELLGWYGYGSNNNHTASHGSQSHSGRSNSSSPGSPKFNEGCGWCGKSVDEATGLRSASATFCCELCFSQSRRANFKKSKTCDWCRHVRHAISYVDSQDGSTQLQFCSDKCLNQYKMHIFWRETRAHLDLHPHLHTAADESSTSSNLITPELWMTKKNNNNSKSPDRPSSSASASPKTTPESPKGLITVAPPSKLMPPVKHDDTSSPTTPTPTIRKRQQLRKKGKRIVATMPIRVNKIPEVPLVPMSSSVEPSDMPQDLRVRHDTPIEPPQAKVPEPEKLKAKSDVGSSLKALGDLMPPSTVLVPYPLVLPLPIPVPIPIPIPIPKNLFGKKFEDASSQTVSEECSTTSRCDEDKSYDSDMVTTRLSSKRKGGLGRKTTSKLRKTQYSS